MIEIRKANEKDIQPIYSFDQMAIDNHENRKEFISSSIESGTCFVAEIDKEVVGYVVLVHSFYSNKMIDMLYVYPKYQRRGVGTKLVQYVETICKTEKLFTSTNQSNLPMQGLLNKLRYVPSGFIDNLDEGDPEIVYFKRIELDR